MTKSLNEQEKENKERIDIGLQKLEKLKKLVNIKIIFIFLQDLSSDICAKGEKKFGNKICNIVAALKLQNNIQKV